MNKILKIILSTIFVGLLIPAGVANPEADSVRLMPEISFSGYIKSDFIFDSRQTVSVRENMLLLYPSPEIYDETGADVNDVGNFQFMPFQTRLRARFSGTEIFNAKTSGLIEGEFFGNTDPTRNEFRLRHASISMEWQTGVSLLMGQNWHPLFITQCFPTTASMNTGIPFNPFARSPQFQISLKTHNFSFSAAAVSQIDFKSAGPHGAGTQYLRNSNLPELTGKVIYVSDNNEFLLGAATSYKQLRPRVTDATGKKVDETVGSASLMGFTKYNRGLTTLKMAGILGQDMFHLTMLGGYAVRSDNSYTDAPLFNQPLYYTPVSTFSAWGEIIYGRQWEFGLFAGYSENLGAKENISLGEGRSPVLYSRGHDIKNLFRVSPRLSYGMKNIRIGAETEYTMAAYSGSLDNYGKPGEADPVANTRLLIFAFYNF